VLAPSVAVVLAMWVGFGHQILLLWSPEKRLAKVQNYFDFCKFSRNIFLKKQRPT